MVSNCPLRRARLHILAKLVDGGVDGLEDDGEKEECWFSEMVRSEGMLREFAQDHDVIVRRGEDIVFGSEKYMTFCLPRTVSHGSGNALRSCMAGKPGTRSIIMQDPRADALSAEELRFIVLLLRMFQIDPRQIVEGHKACDITLHFEMSPSICYLCGGHVLGATPGTTQASGLAEMSTAIDDTPPGAAQAHPNE